MITPDTCLNHLRPGGRREDASFAQSQNQTTSHTPLRTSYCNEDRLMLRHLQCFGGCFYTSGWVCRPVRVQKEQELHSLEVVLFERCNETWFSSADSWERWTWLNLWLGLYTKVCVCVPGGWERGRAHSSLSQHFSSILVLSKKQQCAFFHTSMCWSVCSGMRGISPYSCSIKTTTTTTHTHKHTHSPQGSAQSAAAVAAALCLIDCFSPKGHRYAAPLHLFVLLSFQN